RLFLPGFIQRVRDLEAEIERHERVAQVAQDEKAAGLLQLRMREEFFPRHELRRIDAVRLELVLGKIAPDAFRDPVSARRDLFWKDLREDVAYPTGSSLGMGNVNHRGHRRDTCDPLEESPDHSPGISTQD